MKLGKIYDYRNKEEAKKLVGKKVLATDYLSKIEKRECSISTFLEVLEDSDGLPFIVKNEYGGRDKHQFIREVIEDEPKLMTNRQLAEWIARGNGLWRHDPSNSGVVYNYYWFLEKDMGAEISNNIVIMPNDSNEWVEPTLDIYERDCKA